MLSRLKRKISTECEKSLTRPDFKNCGAQCCELVSNLRSKLHLFHHFWHVFHLDSAITIKLRKLNNRLHSNLKLFNYQHYPMFPEYYIICLHIVVLRVIILDCLWSTRSIINFDYCFFISCYLDTTCKKVDSDLPWLLSNRKI